MTGVAVEAGRRRTFAVISHPDAGKSTMTEALALHASAIKEAGAVQGKAGRRGVTSDWMEIERARGISITSAVLTKYAQSVFGQDRTTMDEAYPGDVVGLVNATALRPGDTLYEGAPVTFPPIPSFAPEHFAVVRARDSSKAKQFRRGIDQLDGPMQFEVVQHRLAAEFGAEITLDRLNYSLARRTDAESAELLARQRGAEVLTRSHDQALLALFSDRWRMRSIKADHPGITLHALIADTTEELQ
jgi:peptide subunit release factor RF-3